MSSKPNRLCPVDTRISRRHFLHTTGIGAIAAMSGTVASGQPNAARRPDIVLIMADDMGFSDIGCFGSEIRTPNLDSLAANGLRFTQFYSTARCCPTRASLMSGLYAHQTGVGHMMSDKGLDGYHGDLNNRCVTIAEALKLAGYHTYMSGKWHLTRFTGKQDPQHNWPLQRGFDRYFGTLTGAGSYFTPDTLTSQNTQIEPPTDDFYYTDAISDHAVGFIQDHARESATEPFLMYVAYTAPHWPLHALQEDIDRYRENYMAGWDNVRLRRWEQLCAQGIVRPEWGLSARDSRAKAWEDLPAERKRRMDLKMAIYAAQIDRMDQGIGRIVNALKHSDRLDNTLIIFLSDNGACAEGGRWGFDRKDGRLGTNDSFSSYGLSWANAGNTPFRLYKHWVHEGGISSPTIIHWPRLIDSPGQLRHQPAHVIDIMPTCLDAAGAHYPSEYDDNSILPCEGKSLLPVFANQSIDREAIYWEHEGNRAVRQGKWKLVSRHGGKWELYDIEADRTELNDLADDYPKTAGKLLTMYGAWMKRCNVVPWPIRPAIGSKKTTFTLSQNNQLLREEAPNVARVPFLIAVTIDRQDSDGVLVAQGGTRVGYSLYIKDAHLAFAVRHHGDAEPTVVISEDPLPARTCSVAAHFANNGSMILTVDGRVAATGKAPGAITDMPTEGLQVGADTQAPVSDYQTPNEFHGTIEALTIELQGKR